MTKLIDGVKTIDLKIHADVRGSFVEFFRQSWLPTDHPALQGNVSRSTSGVLRGMHFHRRQWDYWFVVSGTAFIALVDLRAGSPTERVPMTLRLAAEEPRGLFIPSGVAHGFFAESDTVLGYLLDRYFDGSDEFGFAWNDPNLGIDWPTTDPILSDRDRANPSLAKALEDPVLYATILG
ncbi:MAG: dTDP-4-dehydrorhamnose 3,5-epimerase family protein [Candidatus Eiseniibacteriota bacterium]